MVEYILSAKPGFIDKVVLGITYPGRSKYLRHFPGTCALGIPVFQDTGHDYMTVLSGYQLRKNLRPVFITYAERFIIGSSPEYVTLFSFLTRCMIFEQGIQ